MSDDSMPVLILFTEVFSYSYIWYVISSLYSVLYLVLYFDIALFNAAFHYFVVKVMKRKVSYE